MQPGTIFFTNRTLKIIKFEYAVGVIIKMTIQDTVCIHLVNYSSELVRTYACRLLK